MEIVTESVGDDLSTLKSKTKELTNENRTFANYVENSVIPALGDELTSVNTLTTGYANQRQAILDMIEAYKDWLELLNTEIESYGTDYDADMDYSLVMANYLRQGGSKTDSTFLQLQKEREAKIVGEGLTQQQYKKSGSEFVETLDYNTYEEKDATWLKQQLASRGISSFASGGYTGDWGTDGKLALLHEKEIVLNEEDT
jgi:hypothetical protein